MVCYALLLAWWDTCSPSGLEARIRRAVVASCSVIVPGARTGREEPEL
jgi:hypothetical protein